MKTAIVLIFDEHYSDKAAVFLDSLADNYDYYKELDIICGMPKGSVGAFEGLKGLLNLPPRLNLKLLEVDPEMFSWIDHLGDTHPWITSTAWYRMYLGTLLPDYDKAIYVDADTIAVRDIQPILDYPMYSEFMAATDVYGLEYMVAKNKDYRPRMANGVFIADLNWWRSSGVEEEFTDLILSSSVTLTADEDIFNQNEILRSGWSLLPYTFNFYWFSRDQHWIPDYDKSDVLPIHYKHAIIMHFAGPNKPWRHIGGDDSALGNIWRKRHQKLFKQ